MNQPDGMAAGQTGKVAHHLDVKSPGDLRFELTRFQRAVPGAVENRSEPVPFKQFLQRAKILDRQIENVRRGKPDGVGRKNSKNAPRKAGLKIRQRVIPGDSGDSGDQKRKRRVAERGNVVPLGLVCIAF